jgi:serine/threonine-protein phosphatase 2B regulatory subunit
MVGKNLSDTEIQTIVENCIRGGDKDGDGRLSFEEFSETVDATTLGNMSLIF